MLTLTLHLPGGGERTTQVSQTRGFLGRATECVLPLAGWRVSKRHAEVFVSNERVYLRDLDSTFGTWINEERIDETRQVAPGDKVRVGTHLLSVAWRTGAGVGAGSGEAAETFGAADTAAAGARGGVGRVDTHGGTRHEASTRTPGPGARPQAMASGLAAAARAGGAAAAAPAAAAPALATAAAAKPEPEAATAPEPLHDDSFRYRRLLQERLLEAFDVRRTDTHRMGDDELRQLTERLIDELIGRMTDLPPEIDRVRLREEVRDEAIGLGPLEPLLADPSITEIMVNRADEVFVERGGKLVRLPVAFTSDRAVQGIIERIVAPIGRRIDESSPMVDARLKDGSRVNAVIPPLALKGPSITIRKFSKRKLGAEDLLRFNSASPAMIEFMRVCVEQRKNVLISGGTGSGKTTLLNILSNFIPLDERIVTIEDAAELQLHHPNLVSMEARPANIEGKGLVAIRDLVKNSLRMRPDRIVVGECRGGESLDMLQAMNTGHDGSLTTAHANSPRDMLARLEVMVLMAGMDLPVSAIREQVASAVDIIVQQTRFACGTRKVTSIVEVTGVESGKIQLQEVFAFVQTGVTPEGKTQGHFTGRGFTPEFYEELAAIGVPLDLGIFHDGMAPEERSPR